MNVKSIKTTQIGNAVYEMVIYDTGSFNFFKVLRNGKRQPIQLGGPIGAKLLFAFCA